MKKFFTQQINFAYAVIVILVLVAGIGQAAAVQSNGYAVPGESPVPIIHQGGGDQAVNALRLGQCPPGNPSNEACGPIGALDTRGGPIFVTLFDTTLTGGTFSVLDDSVFLKTLYIAEDASTAIASWLSSHNGIATPIQKVNVDGDVLITSLTHGLGLEEDVCVSTDGTLVLCPDLVGGSCGLPNGQNFSSPPSIGLCSAGIESAVTTNPSTYDWTCTGTGGTANCQANRIIPVDGICGSAAGHTYSSPPTNGLCSVGNAGPVGTNSNTYNWFCYGTGGGTAVACEANRTTAINGQCQVFNSGPYATQPANSSNGCIAGVYNDLSEGAGNPPPWKWECNGTNGGTDDTPCFADAAPIGDPSCKPYSGTYSSQPASNNSTGCDVGTYADFADNSTNWRWTCTENSVTNTCSALKQAYDGYSFICGTDPNGTFGPGQSAPANSRWGEWTRGTGYDPNGGDSAPYTLGSYDCSDPTTIPFMYSNPHTLPNGQNPNSPVNDGYDGVVDNPSGQGDKLYYKFFCLEAAPSDCFCNTAGANEQMC